MYVKCDTVKNQIRTKSLLKKLPIRHLYMKWSIITLKTIETIIYTPKHSNHIKLSPTNKNGKTASWFRNVRLHLRNPTEKTETQGSKRFAVFPLLETNIYSVSLVNIQCLSGIRFWKNSLEQVSVERKVTQIKHANLRRAATLCERISVLPDKCREWFLELVLALL